MKTISAQYHEVKAQAQRCKPHSRRKVVLTERLSVLLHRQMKIENKQKS